MNSLGLLTKAVQFQTDLPYKDLPYSSRNWGHELHSLCSYQGKFKPAHAHWLVRSFTSKNMTVLDPLGGVGTIALEACLQGRYGISSDLSPFASVVGLAKVNPPTKEDVISHIDYMKSIINDIDLNKSDFEDAKFGLNSSVEEFYHIDTLKEVLKFRKYFLSIDSLTPTTAFIKASMLHILHGNRPYALSRNSHPITPFSPTGESEYRSVIDRLYRRAELTYREPLPNTFVRGVAFHSDFRNLPTMNIPIADCIITSPPFIGMRFDRPNWLRLWFCGWDSKDFKTTSMNFVERQQSKNDMSVYRDFFDICNKLTTKNGFVLVHIGGSDNYDMESPIIKLADEWFKCSYIVNEDVKLVERHGINDKGNTNNQKILFLEKR
jgi:hypothetical protein